MLICILTSIYPFSAFSDSRENLKILRERIQSLQKDLTDEESRRKNTFDTLQETEQIIDAINYKLNELTVHYKESKSQFNDIKVKKKKIEEEIEIERDQLQKLLYRQYLGGQQGYIRLMLSQQDPHQISRNAYYYKQLLLARSDSIKRLQTYEYEIQALAKASHQKRKEIRATQAEYLAQRKVLEQEKSKYQVMMVQISGQITQRQQEITKLERDEKRLSNLANKISNLIVNEKVESSLNNEEFSDVPAMRTPFPSFKGRLNLPVRGKLLNSFGGQRSGKHVTWKGLFIQAPSGSDVKAISEGRVVFADWLRGFGNLIIIDHGNDYLSLYGNNETLHKQVGSAIKGGDSIATVGNSSGNADSGLYFELRHKGKPFDPLKWMKID